MTNHNCYTWGPLILHGDQSISPPGHPAENFPQDTSLNTSPGYQLSVTAYGLLVMLLCYTVIVQYFAKSFSGKLQTTSSCVILNVCDCFSFNPADGCHINKLVLYCNGTENVFKARLNEVMKTVPHVARRKFQ